MDNPSDIIEQSTNQSNESEQRKVSDLPEDNKQPVFRGKIVHSNESIFCTCPEDFEIKSGDYVIAPTRYGKDLCIIQGQVKNLAEIEDEELISILKVSTPHDLSRYETNKLNEKRAFEICQQKIEEHKLEMNLVSVHYLLDEAKIIFFFTAETRVDFRELVKTLVSIFKMRIELRQIGVRDESRIIGGIGVCGRGLCCHTITDKLKPVSIKMAKEQNLSLNSIKISGPCGRLLCCLGYEYDFYRCGKENLPEIGTQLQVMDDNFTVAEVNILSKKIKLTSEAGVCLNLDFKNLICYKDENNEMKWDVTLEDDDLVAFE